jgi:hypothetical protein
MCQLDLLKLGAYTIFDALGRETTRSDLAPGTYFIKADDETKFKVVLVR